MLRNTRLCPSTVSYTHLWMAKMEDNCRFISAREKINMEELKSVVYQRVKELHVQKYPYNDFLYQTYEEEV